MKDLARPIAMMISFTVIYLVLNHLNNRDDAKPPDEEGKYTVCIPSALSWVYLALFGLGVILFAVFLFSYAAHAANVTPGHLYMSVSIMGIGVLIMSWAHYWRIVVDKDQISVHRLFRRTKTFPVSELTKAVAGKKGELILYRNGKKLVTVDFLCDNYSWFRKYLEGLGKLEVKE